MKLDSFKLKSMGLIFIVIITFALMVTFLLHEIKKEVNNAGGVRGIVVTTGKEIKSIVNEINAQDSTKIKLPEPSSLPPE